jgi:ferredoxin-NADP reductase
MDPADGRPFIVTGPPMMVEAMERVLDELDIPTDRRRIERFSPPR